MLELKDVIDVKYPNENSPRRGRVSDVSSEDPMRAYCIVWDDSVNYPASLMLSFSYKEGDLYISGSNQLLEVTKVDPTSKI